MDNDGIDIKITSNSSNVEQGTQKAGRGVRGVQREARGLDAAFRRLKSSIDPTFQATERYNKTLQENQRLLKAGRISQEEYAKGAIVAKEAMDLQIASLIRGTAAGKAAAQEARRQAAEAKREARAQAEVEKQEARKAAQEKITAARQASAAVELAKKKEITAIRLAAVAARQAATEARAYANRAASPSVTRGVQPGSIETNGRSIKQLAYDAERAMQSAAKAAQVATNAAAKAAESSSARVARAAEMAAEKARAAAEAASAKAIQLSRAQASEEGRNAQIAANAVRAGKQKEREAIRDAARAAKAAATERRQAELLTARAARESAEASRRAAIAEKQSAQAATELRASIDPVFAAQTRYNNVMQRATQLLLENKLRQGEWTQIQRQAKAQMDVNVRSMGQMNSTYVQLGYQAQDVTASLASGIHPLVILAQQGGQTAAALAGMGGAIGKVAAFMAGPWGAAIIGFTLLIGLMMGKSKEAEKATLDLRDAEKLRTASLEELNEALRDFNKEQKQANENNYEALMLAQGDAERGSQAAQNKLKLAQEEYDKAEKAYKAASTASRDAQSEAGGELGAVALAMAGRRLRTAAAQLKLAKDTYGIAQSSQIQTDIQAMRRAAEASSDEGESIKQKYEQEEAGLKMKYALARQMLNPLTEQVKIQELQAQYRLKMIEMQKRQKKEEEDLAERTKKTNKAAGDGVAVFKSRQQAIGMAGKELQQAGFKVTENDQFGGVKGRHKMKDHGKYAIDVNIPGAGVEADNPGYAARMEQVVRSYQARGYRVLWNGRVYEPKGEGPGKKISGAVGLHRDHAHMEAPKDLVGKPTGASDGAFDRNAQSDALAHYIEDLEYQQQIANENYTLQLELQDKKIAALKAYHGEESREVVRASREKLAIERRQEQFILQEKKESLDKQLNLMEMAERQKQELQSIERGQKSDEVDFSLQNGMISQREALQEKISLMNQEYADTVAHEQRMYQLRVKTLRDQLALANLPAEEKRRINTQIELMEAEHQSRLAIMKRQQVREVNAATYQMAELNTRIWREVSQTIGQSMSSVFQGIWTKSASVGQLLIQMADQLAFKFFDMGIKIVQDWAVAQLTKKALSTSTDAAEVASHTATETAKTGITAAALTARGSAEAAALTVSTIAGIASRVAQVIGLSGVAGAAAFASTAAIPIVGPALAPAAMAGAIASVMGMVPLASAAGGQERVPYDGQITELHKDEMVLPAWMAGPFRKALRSPSTSGMPMAAAMAGASTRGEMVKSISNSARVTVPITLSAIDTQSGADFVMKHARDIGKAVAKSVRQGMRS